MERAPYTLFDNAFDVTGHRFEATPDEFFDLLADAANHSCSPSSKNYRGSISCTHFDPKRGKANALGAATIALDSDDGWSIDDAVAALDDLGCAYIIHTTTKSTVEAHRFRVFLFLSRLVDAETYDALWLALARRWSAANLDVKTRDISRLSTLPARWEGCDHHEIEAYLGGDRLDPDAMIAAYPAPPKIETPAPVRGVFDPMADARNRLRKMRNAKVPSHELVDLNTSPIVPQDMLRELLASKAGGRTWKLLCSVASRARLGGYTLTVDDLTTIADRFSELTRRGRADRAANRREAVRAMQLAERGRS